MNKPVDSTNRKALNKINETITFVQSDLPPLKVAEYTMTITQTTNTEAPNTFRTSRNFAVTGKRFSFQGDEISGIFPPDLGNGEYDGSLASVVFTRRTLPWERYLSEDDDELPWLAILLFDSNNKPVSMEATAKDLVKLNQPITVLGNETLTGTGTLPADTLSYPKLEKLGYGESPDDKCSIIDIDLDTFNQVAPSKKDLYYLAQIRITDTIDTVKNGGEETTYSVVIANRIAANNQTAYAYLVSLEEMGDYLPKDDGKPTVSPNGIKKVRLICYQRWSYTANTLDQDFRKSLENLNKPAADGQKYTTLQFPGGAAPPAPDQVTRALQAQEKGTLDADGAKVIAQNAFNQGYIPMNHEMRHGSQSISWYRGPLTPYTMNREVFHPSSCPDAANRYNPQTGLFDVSYGAAWQLGQFMALQNKNYANALFNWKRQVHHQFACQEEQRMLEERLFSTNDDSLRSLCSGFLNSRILRLNDPPPVPAIVSTWLGGLKFLDGVPFQYLVPNEQMLPIESIRFFHLDLNWIDYLLDGAFSIGRTSSDQHNNDSLLFGRVRNEAHLAAFSRRTHRVTTNYLANTAETYTGFILRSLVVSGWPDLQVNGYGEIDNEDSELKKIRMEKLAEDSLLVIFDGDVKQVAIHEPPMLLHCGIEINTSPYSTTLRAVVNHHHPWDVDPGYQYKTNPAKGSVTADIPMRSDKQTILISQAAANILTKLNGDFQQGIKNFTSAEFTLQLIKGVVKASGKAQ